MSRPIESEINKISSEQLQNLSTSNTSKLNSTSATASSTLTAKPSLPNGGQVVSIDETPNKIVYKKIESMIEKMQDDSSGVPIKTVKSFMSKIPSVFTGTDLIQWMLKKIDVEDACEALHFAHLISSHGYIFPIDDHILTVKNDGTFFRFQVNSSEKKFKTVKLNNRFEFLLFKDPLLLAI
jgi:hypothetical protein